LKSFPSHFPKSVTAAVPNYAQRGKEREREREKKKETNIRVTNKIIPHLYVK